MDFSYTAPLCTTCQNMMTRISPYLDQLSQDDVRGAHHETTKSLLMSAAWGCGICSQLAKSRKKYMIRPEYCWPVGRGPWMHYTLSSWLTVNGDLAHQWDFSGQTDKEFITYLLDIPFDMEPFQNKEHLRHLDCGNTGGAEVIDKARSWLSNCLSNHDCNSVNARVGYRPPRLLELGEGTMRLIESDKSVSSGDYATLSYCWGRNPGHLTLTTHNIDTLRRGVRTERLAKTFREAIEVTRALGVQFLWIDALCILQSGEGSREDWQKHITEMGVIYANCSFNIAADHGENAEVGCFVARDPDTVKPCVIYQSPIPEQGWSAAPSQDEPRPRNARQIIDTEFWKHLLEDNALFGRGWVHQERLLSPRILHFGERQLAWECTKQIACETFPFGQKRMSRSWQSTPFSFCDITPQLWHRIVEAYSGASLTNAQDRLPAIAGIAKLIADDRAARYVGGHFEKDMPETLIWSHEGTSLSCTTTLSQAPSWSWASRMGKVHFWLESTTNVVTYAYIKEVSLDHTDSSNVFGCLKGGSIRIIAPMFRILSMTWLDGRDNNDRSFEVRCDIASYKPWYTTNPRQSLTGCIQLDESPLARPRSETMILFVKHHISRSYGLLVTASDTPARPNRFVRVGMCFFHDSETEHSLGPGKTLYRYLRDCSNTTVELE